MSFLFQIAVFFPNQKVFRIAIQRKEDDSEVRGWKRLVSRIWVYYGR